MSSPSAGAARRAAFDIGSGSTKLVVADVLGESISKVLFEKEVPVSFAIAWKRSADGNLSEEVQAQGLDVLRGFTKVCDEHEVPVEARRGIATEVFRKAANGGAYLERVLGEVGLSIEVVSQLAEAELGFRTAVALQGRPAEDVICWDSGGASFQITSLGPGGGPLRSYVGTWGTGNTTALLVEAVQARSFAEAPTPNPVSAAQVAALVRKLKSELAEPAEWLCGRQVTAIGGLNSMFCVMSEAFGGARYTLADVRGVLETLTGRSDEELAPMAFCQGERREPPGWIIPKLCLLLSVIEHCGISEVQFCPAIGSCPGLLISQDRYAPAGQP